MTAVIKLMPLVDANVSNYEFSSENTCIFEAKKGEIFLFVLFFSPKVWTSGVV